MSLRKILKKTKLKAEEKIETISNEKVPRMLWVNCPKCNGSCGREHRGLYMMWGMKCSSCGYVFDIENKYYKGEDKADDQ